MIGRPSILIYTVLSLGGAVALSARAAEPPAPSPSSLIDPRESHFSQLRQLTFGGENAEAYWSPDGRELSYQAHVPPYECDQIFRLNVAETEGKEPIRVSNGTGRTTCSYFLASGERVIFSSTHGADAACPASPDRSKGYVWPLYSTYEIWSTKPDGSDPVRLTENSFYDAESTVCLKDGSVIFTSDRDGDLELYRTPPVAAGANPDFSKAVRLTHAPGYDGGAFFSPDCTKIVWRASRPKPGPELEDFQSLLAQHLVRPSQLEIWVAEADGRDPRQITYLGAASFAPSFFPTGDRILFSSNHADLAAGGKGREFDLWAVDVNGSNLERITYADGFDGFPLFSPDGRQLAFSSNRNQKNPGDTNVFLAEWREFKRVPSITSVERYDSDVAWLAQDEREGRGIGTRGLAAAADWLEAQFREIGLAPSGVNGTYRQEFPVTVAIESGAGTSLAIDGQALAAEAFRPLGFSSSGGPTIEAEVVPVGYGITAADLGRDDYEGKDVRGKIALVRRFVPSDLAAKGTEIERKQSDLRAKAWAAREHGAVGLLVVDLPEIASGEEMPAEAPLPALSTSDLGDAGLVVAAIRRAEGEGLFAGGKRARLAVELTRRTESAVNIVGVLRAGTPEKFAGATLVGAHYDHLGFGGAGSLEPDSTLPHNGADDNASGTAALLEAARTLVPQKSELRRDVWFVAFSGEESGVLGSTAFTRTPPAGLALGDLVAMVNMDMVGRLRDNRLQILGGDSSEGWSEIVEPACERAKLLCTLGGDGYGPSDHSPFYAAGAPVLHLFSGTHTDYHRPSDDADKINAIGGARVAGLAADLALQIANRPEKLAYKSVPAPAPAGDIRSSGAALGTVPDYAGDGRPGVLLSGVRAGSAAEKAGIQRGDLLVELAGTEIRDIQDMMFVLRRSKPGDHASAVVVRDGKKVTLEVEFGVNTRLR